MYEVQVANGYLCGLVGACARIVEEQHQGIITHSLGRPPVRDAKQGVHLRLFKVGERPSGGFLEWNLPDLGAPSDVLGTMGSDEIGQGMDRRQPLVTRRNGAAPTRLQMGEEVPHAIG